MYTELIQEGFANWNDKDYEHGYICDVLGDLSSNKGEMDEFIKLVREIIKGKFSVEQYLFSIDAYDVNPRQAKKAYLFRRDVIWPALFKKAKELDDG